MWTTNPLQAMLTITVCILSAERVCAQDDAIERLTEDAILGETHNGLLTAFREHFQESSPTKLLETMSSRSATLSIRAAWERVRKSSREVEQDGLSESVRNRFCGFVEGRLGTAVPQFWEEALMGMRSNTKGQQSFPLPTRTEHLAISGSDSGLLGNRVLTPKGISVEDDGKKVAISSDAKKVEIPRQLVRRALGVGIIVGVDAAFDGDTCFFTLRYGQCDPYQIAAIDVKSGRELWSSMVWAAGGDVTYIGRPYHVTSLSLQKDTLVVFGAGNDCLYVETFSRHDGQAKCRFSTSR